MDLLQDYLLEQLLKEDLDSVYDGYYKQHMERDVFDKVIALDPTFNIESNKLGTYGKWLLTKQRQGLLPDDLNSVTEILNDFNDRKKYLKGNPQNTESPDKGKDINAYKNVDEIRAALDSIELTDNQRAKLARKAKHYADLGEEAEFIGETDKWEIWRPLTYAADAKLGSGSTWCTASSRGGDLLNPDGTVRSYGYFTHYTQDRDHGGWRDDTGKLYVFLNKQDSHEKWQARVGDVTRTVTDFMDIDDSPSLPFDLFVAKEGLYDLLMTTELADVKEVQLAKTRAEIFKLDTVIVKRFSTGWRDEVTITSEEHPEDEIKLSLKNADMSHFKHIIVQDTDFSELDQTQKEVFNFAGVETLDFSECRIELVAEEALVSAINLKKIILPETVKYIKARAFAGCKELEEFIFPDKLEYIGMDAFKDCDKVKFYKEKGQKVYINKTNVDFFKNHMNYIEVPQEESLNEAFSESMPGWLTKLLAEIKNSETYGHFMTCGIDFNHAEFKDVDVPRNGNSPYLHYPYLYICELDNSQHGWGDREEHRQEDLYAFNTASNRPMVQQNARWSSRYQSMEDVSLNILSKHIVHMCVLDMQDPSNFNTDLRTKRRDAKRGAVVRYNKEVGDNMVKNIVSGRRYSDLRQYGTPVLDKSGYIVDPIITIQKLNANNRANYSKTLSKFYKTIKEARKQILDEFSSLDIKNRRYDENEINHCLSLLQSVISDYRDFLSRINRALSLTSRTEKSKALDDLFKFDVGIDGSRVEVGYAENLRKKIENLKKECKEIGMTVLEDFEEKE